jgi:hypothetical protein
MLDDARRIVEEASQRGIHLKLLGAIAIRLNASKYADLFLRLNRLSSENKFTDIDLAAYGKQRIQVRRLLQELGFEVNQQSLLMHGNSRMIFEHAQKGYSLDVFFDKLQFSHDVEFGRHPGKGRLSLNPPTLPPADLVLEKLQIHEINEKDLKDLVLLFAANAIGRSEAENVINGEHIASILSGDWEFWYEAKLNLEKLLKFLGSYVNQKVIEADVETIVRNRVEELTRFIDEEPKSKDWQKRSKAGPEKKWWRDVEERSR